MVVGVEAGSGTGGTFHGEFAGVVSQEVHRFKVVGIGGDLDRPGILPHQHGARKTVFWIDRYVSRLMKVRSDLVIPVGLNADLQ